MTVPNVVGMAEADARRAIQNAGLGNTFSNYQTANDVQDKAFFNRTAPGRVLSQTPAPGSSAPRGTTTGTVMRCSWGTSTAAVLPRRKTPTRRLVLP